MNPGESAYFNQLRQPMGYHLVAVLIPAFFHTDASTMIKHAEISIPAPPLDSPDGSKPADVVHDRYFPIVSQDHWRGQAWKALGWIRVIEQWPESVIQQWIGWFHNLLTVFCSIFNNQLINT